MHLSRPAAACTAAAFLLLSISAFTRMPALSTPVHAQATAPTAARITILTPARVFDGTAMHEGWGIRVVGDRIEAAGPAGGLERAGATVIDLPGATLLPGLIEAHAHVLLHPYNETT